MGKLETYLPAATGGGGGYNRAANKALFFSEHCADAIDYADANEKFFELWNDTNQWGYSLTADHATLAAALLVEADRKLIYRDDHWMTYGWLHPNIRTAFMDTYDPGFPKNKMQVYHQPSNILIYWLGWSKGGDYFWHWSSWASGSTLYLVECTTPWDLTTAQTPTTVNMSTAGFSGFSSTYIKVGFSPDGTKMFLSDGTNMQYATLSTAWDLTSIGTVNSIAWPTGTTVSNWCFNSDGTEVFYWSNGSDGVYKAELSTGYDFSTMTQADTTLYFEDFETGVTPVRDISFSPDGKVFFMQGTIFMLTTAYDLSTVDLTKAHGGGTHMNERGQMPRYLQGFTSSVTSYAMHIDGTVHFQFYSSSDTFAISQNEPTDEEFTRGAEFGYQGQHGFFFPSPGVKCYDNPSDGASSVYQCVISWSDDGLTYCIGSRDNANSGNVTIGQVRIPFLFAEGVYGADNIKWEHQWDKGTDFPHASIHPDGKGWEFLGATLYNYRLVGLKGSDWNIGNAYQTTFDLQMMVQDNITRSAYSFGSGYEIVMDWSPDGTRMIAAGRDGSTVYMASYESILPFTYHDNNSSYDTVCLLNNSGSQKNPNSSDARDLGSLTLGRDGTTMMISQQNHKETAYGYTMSTPWDVSAGSLSLDGYSGDCVATMYLCCPSGGQQHKFTRNRRWVYSWQGMSIFRNSVCMENL